MNLLGTNQNIGILNIGAIQYSDISISRGPSGILEISTLPGNIRVLEYFNLQYIHRKKWNIGIFYISNITMLPEVSSISISQD